MPVPTMPEAYPAFRLALPERLTGALLDCLTHHVNRRCQTNTSRFAQPHNRQISGRKLTPLRQGGGTIEFEVFAIVKMTFPIEMIVDRGEFLERLCLPEFRHRPLSSCGNG